MQSEQSEKGMKQDISPYNYGMNATDVSVATSYPSA